MFLFESNISFVKWLLNWLINRKDKRGVTVEVLHLQKFVQPEHDLWHVVLENLNPNPTSTKAGWPEPDHTTRLELKI